VFGTAATRLESAEETTRSVLNRGRDASPLDRERGDAGIGESPHLGSRSGAKRPRVKRPEPAADCKTKPSRALRSTLQPPGSDIPADETRKIVRGNAIKFFKLDIE
jgi:hypothetical protein